MRRVDFLLSVFLSLALLRHFLRGEEWVVYIAFALMPIYALLAWLLQIQINILKRKLRRKVKR